MADSTNQLCDAVHRPASSNTRLALIAHLWPGARHTPMQRDLSLWDAYFSFYNRECSSALIDEGKYFCARTHQDIIRISELLISEPTKDCVKFRMSQDLSGQRTLEEESKMVESSITVVVRLFAMVKIAEMPAQVSGQLALPWHDGCLQKTICDYFRPPQCINDDDMIFKSDFTARNCNRLAGLGVVWTDNLVDHLRLVESDRKVCIFHHITYLKWLEMTQSPLFPDEFLRETRETLVLLFPSKDRKTKRWLESEFKNSSGRLGRGLLQVGSFNTNHPSRRLKHYGYWRERLGALFESVEDSNPPSKALLKALSDRKRGDGWLNSWVAIVAICLTLFFGLVQSIEGAIQVY